MFLFNKVPRWILIRRIARPCSQDDTYVDRSYPKNSELRYCEHAIFMTHDDSPVSFLAIASAVMLPARGVKYSQVTRVYRYVYVYVYMCVNGLRKRDGVVAVARRCLTNCTFLMYLVALASDDGGGTIFLPAWLRLQTAADLLNTFATSRSRRSEKLGISRLRRWEVQHVAVQMPPSFAPVLLERPGVSTANNRA